MVKPNRVHPLPIQPKLLPYLDVLHATDGTICLLSPGQGILLKLPKSLTRVIDQVLAQIDGNKTVPEIIEAVKDNLPGTETEMVMVVLNYLFRQKMLFDNAVPTPDELDEYSRKRWSRNLTFFMPFENSPITRFDYQIALKNASVALIGLGGTGSWTAYNLAMAGVGKIVGVDSDQVSLDNLNRQVLYRPSDIGKNKIDVTAQVLGAVSPTLKFEGVIRRIESEEDISKIIHRADLLILGADQPQGLIERWANAACFAQRVPWLRMGLQSYQAFVGPLFVPAFTGCWACTDTSRRLKSKYYAEALDTLATLPPTEQPSFAPMCSLVGGLAAYEAIKYLSGFVRPAILGREMRIDSTTMQIKWQNTKQRTDCAICHIPTSETPRQAGRLPPRSNHNFLSRLFHGW